MTRFGQAGRSIVLVRFAAGTRHDADRISGLIGASEVTQGRFASDKFERRPGLRERPASGHTAAGFQKREENRMGTGA